MDITSYSIQQTAHLTAIKAHTLRTWEKRGFILSAARAKNNTRFYFIEDIELLMNLSLLIDCGHRISLLSRQTKDTIHQNILAIRDETIRQRKVVNDLIISMYKIDTESFESIFEESIATWGEKEVLTNIVFKFLDITGLLWRGNRLLEEHFVVTFLRRKLMYAIESVRKNALKTKTVLLFLPDKGQLDLLLLHTHYILKARGLTIYYIGNDISLSNLKTAIDTKKPDFIITCLTNKPGMDEFDLVPLLAQNLFTKLIILDSGPDKRVSQHNILFLNYSDAMDFIG